jgi:hypothetical protein
MERSDAPAAPALLDSAFSAAKMAYNLSNGRDPYPGWARVPYPADSEKGKALSKAEAFEVVAPDGQRFVTFTGTNRKGDVLSDAGNFVGIKTGKYLAAATVGELYRGENVVMTGHSLGGGLAKTAAAVASHSQSEQEKPAPCVAVGFNAAPIGTRVLAEHGVDAKHLESETIAVVNRNDAINRYTWGGKLYAGRGGAAITERGNPDEVLVIADGKGSAWGFSGHSIADLADPKDPTKLTERLSIGENPVQKATFDRFARAREAISDPREVSKTLDTVKALHHEQSRGLDGL